MEQMLPTIEAFAHYTRGAISLFFVFWCFILYAYRQRNRMMKLLYVATLYLSFSYLKDAVFLFYEWKDSILLNDLVITIDLLCIPLICAFFLEAVRPGMVSNKMIAIAVSIQSLFIVAFACYPDESIVTADLLLVFVMSVATIGYVQVFASKYRRFITSNYSYSEHIDVTWVAVSCVVYFLTIFLYFVAFQETTWLSEILFSVFFMVLWTFLYLFARRHRVIKMLMPIEKEAIDSPEERSGEDAAEEHSPNQRDEMLKTRLEHVLVEDKIYLNPKITLGEVALAIGSNKTYLSDYINNTLHTTFYDFINTYRITEARLIIEAMPQEGRKSMAVVAEMSGFNSLSTFNRHFVRVVGISPKQYYTDSLKKEYINQ